MVGHAGDVVADHSMAWLGSGQLGILFWHASRVLDEKEKKRVERSHGAVAILCDCGVRIEPGVKKPFQLGVLASYLGRKGGQAIGKTAHVFDGLDSAFQYSAGCVVD